METNDEKLEELKKIQEELREEVRNKSISELWEFWKFRDDQVLLANGKKLLRVNIEIRVIKQTLERAEAEAKNKQNKK